MEKLKKFSFIKRSDTVSFSNVKESGKKRSIEMSSDVLKHMESRHLYPTPDNRTYTFKLGWIQGVLIPCLLNIWGVTLFLRISWVVAQAGIALTLLIIAISTIVCIITTLSLSAICTNGIVQGGGVYYLVSRSLGAELGASVGIIFAFANAVAASMNTIGFCDSFNDLLRRYNLKIIDNGTNDVRLVGTIAIFLMCLICAIGMDWESKTQNILIVIILLAIFNYILGACIGPLNDRQRAQGFVGIQMEVANRNWIPDFRYHSDRDHNFFSVFAMYFPSVTGIQAGANICGDLKDPASAIPKGTLLAVLISTFSYVTMTLLCGVAGLRDASGNYTHISDYDALEKCKPNCAYGLHNNYEMMQLMALWNLLIFFGCWAATLSTALTNVLAVPKLIQALGKDQIYPGLAFFAKPYGRLGEPYRGYVLTFVVSLFFLCIADLNTIAPLITNFYLASYALINFCTFHAGFVGHISWRPQFRFYNIWLSLFGFIVCLVIMMVISWVMALVTVLIFLTLYLLVHYRKPSANWGSSTDAHRYVDAVNYLLNMAGKEEAIKSYNPQLLVLAGPPFLRPGLVDIGHLITKPGSFMIVADIEKEELTSEERLVRCEVGQEWLNDNKYRGFYVVLDKHLLDQGVSALLQCAGLGRFSPNILLVGFLTNWSEKPYEDVEAYFRALQTAYEHNVALTVLRAPDDEYNLRKKMRVISKDRALSFDVSGTDQVRALLSTDSEENLKPLTAPEIDEDDNSFGQKDSTTMRFVSEGLLKRHSAAPKYVGGQSAAVFPYWMQVSQWQ
ncbi:bumetanide-sensitive sodium-(potassium)-chloride cotransporter-like [Pectinophora gossypiella]|uniref:bumetanide-sensitive sodium-(potassium)-chloride cotransporter-like n=1 Tax=Pectinophora gossypiella TaxID=13191 RepID=UPI00214EAEF0|nr:bumetanide-sensitive sodium-(potassium)-chloride cotransporter-like [Pectinophora gossypiella]